MGHHHAQFGRAITWVDGQWMDGNPPILGAMHHAVWLSSVVFDGARSVRGMAPDLDLHCARVVHSAHALALAPPLDGAAVTAIAREGIQKFDANAELYIKPVIYAEEGLVTPLPESTRFVMVIFEAALPEPEGFSAGLSSFRRPARDMAPTDAKAACLYPNVARAVAEAHAKGFDQPVVLDPNGNVAEFGYMNLFFVSGGKVVTPAINGTFLNGITRQRVLSLLRADGFKLEERAVQFDELLAADEIFATGNYAKVQPCTHVEHRALEEGPVAQRARALYWKFAESQKV
ncbi:branched-chain amino acid aminotransferase [Magnetospira sp. QH-2]|uniref:branched-chain amino acid aminotransferase n=1 Tax=Magnetospira sp. (strain QH-2) TaxID=1288970 RepID=UPI0003E80D38|nr:branched-chain amino acid aminotransferase [Magnetospira sp. QH-2]CCQ72654.1 Branched-chain-amino-acid aminotransferase [Magnetospira sp. QH-2]